MKIPFDNFTTNNLLTGLLALQILKNQYGETLDISAELYHGETVNSFVEKYKDISTNFNFFIDTVSESWNWNVTTKPCERYCETMEEFLELLKEPPKIEVRNTYKNKYGSIITILQGTDGKFLLGGNDGDPLQLLGPVPELKTVEQILEFHKIDKWVLVGNLNTKIEFHLKSK